MFEKRILLPHQYYYPHMMFFEDRASAEKEAAFRKHMEMLNEPERATIYVHIPFCNSKCAFCGFDKEYALSEMEAYTDKLCQEIDYYAGIVGRKYIIQSVHFGGGTPALLPAPLLQRILDRIRGGFDLRDDTAVDMEGSATTLPREDIIRFILNNHLTRVSFGIQSFHEGIRRELMMKATLDDVQNTIRTLKENGIIMYGDILYGYPAFFPSEMFDIMVNDIQTAIDSGLDGVEFGQMYPYKNTLERIVRARGLRLPDDSEIIRMIRKATAMLLDAGYSQSTYSGFTRQGKIILETSYYGGIEKMPDCIAFGSGAFGSVAGYKYRNASYSVYMTQETPCYGQLKAMTQEKIENMQIVGFPKVLVLDKRLLQKPSVRARFAGKMAALAAEGYITETDTQYRLTERGSCYIDNIYWYLLEDTEKEHIQKELTIYIAEGKASK